MTKAIRVELQARNENNFNANKKEISAKAIGLSIFTGIVTISIVLVKCGLVDLY